MAELGRAHAESRGFARGATLSLWLVLVGAAVAALGVPGCLERRDEPVSDPAATQCASCHGDPARSGDAVRRAAPPYDLMRNSTPEYPGVGAHDIHLNASATHAAVACDECHVVPTDVDSPGHADDGPPGDITFGALAQQGDRAPYYDAAARTCQASYCHGGAWPVWTSPRPSDEACGSCHGLPPPSPHPQSNQCSACHGEVIDAERHFIAPERHVDGVVDYQAGDCRSCHGSSKNAAPPRDTAGNQNFSALGVGAHQVHLEGGADGRPVECSECHVVPKNVAEPTHADGLPAELTFSGVARAADHEPSWSHSKATCSDAYCHGPSPGDGRSSPVWNEEQPLGCTSCHGLPPPAPHPQSENCASCHGAVVADDNRTIIDKTRHVDGKVDYLPASCHSCHGSDDNAAPPRDVAGNSASSALGVGAHQAHLGGGDNSRPVECTACHIVPQLSNEPQHVDGVPAELTFAGLARAMDRDPSWHPSTATCSDTYCHAPSPGQSHDSAVWNEDTSLGCGSCHGLPPPSPHPQSDQCSACHSAIVGSDNRTILDKSRHVNGQADVDIDATCTSCHGAATPAPPLDTEGNESTTSPGVGAHQTHVRGTARSRAVPCAECHQVPEDLLDPGHVDSARPAELAFSGVALANGARPTYENGTCQSTTCHGAVFPYGDPSGGSNTTPTWTNVDGTEAACGSCHSIPPPPPHPGPGNACHDCHGNIAADDMTFTSPEEHVDGIVTLR